MPHLTTFGGSYFSTGRLAFEDRIDADFDANDFGLRTKGIVHPNYSPDGVAQRNTNDGFQAEGDIKGIIHPNYSPDGVAQRNTNDGFQAEGDIRESLIPTTSQGMARGSSKKTQVLATALGITMSSTPQTP